MKVLFLTTSKEDYLQDGLLYGLRQRLGSQCVDFPKKEVMYTSCSKNSGDLYGNGFTLWKLLEDIDIDRTEIEKKIVSRYFDVIVFGSVVRQWATVLDFAKKGLIKFGQKLFFFDGEDAGELRRKQVLGLFWRYFKREQSLFTRPFCRVVNFCIPSQKLQFNQTPKVQMFAKHVQCEEAYKIPWVKENCQVKYAFADEFSYRRNISESYYGITMKKAGWDCMRHYEIAGSGTVMAFYRLSEKSRYCAPHGLIDMENVIAWSSADELLEKIEVVGSQDGYERMRNCSFQWAVNNTCENLVGRLFRFN